MADVTKAAPRKIRRKKKGPGEFLPRPSSLPETQCQIGSKAPNFFFPRNKIDEK
jgi:hypothetical protein